MWRGDAKPPILVIGMHRSGTSLVARLLERMGVFMGKRKEENHEALFFLERNRWLFRQCGARWDDPRPVRDLLDDAGIRRLAADHLRRVIGSPLAVPYLGWRKFLRYGAPSRLGVPWGWKDPRNTFTLPVWLELFPRARIVHVCRHGVDVAGSLRVRHRRALERTGALAATGRRFRRWPLEHGFGDSVRCGELDGGLSLWEQYMAAAGDHERRLGARAIRIRFEDLLEDPRRELRRLAAHCGIAEPSASFDGFVDGLDAGRAFAYRDDPELAAFAARSAERLRVHGY